jgi:hypothetical protein
MNSKRVARELQLDLIRLRLDQIKNELHPELELPLTSKRSSSHKKEAGTERSYSPVKTTRTELKERTPSMSRFKHQRLDNLGPGSYTPTLPHSNTETAFFGTSKRFHENYADWMLRKT